MKFLRPTRHIVSIVTLILGFACVASSGQSSKPEQPQVGEGKGQPPQSEAAPSQQQAAPERGTVSNPVVIQLSETKEQAAQNEQDRRAEADTKGWTIWLYGLTILVGAGQIYMIRKQAEIAKRQNSIMDTQTAIMKGQLKSTTDGAEAVDEQAHLMRQQLVGTLGAVIECSTSLTQESSILFVNIYFTNLKEATAKDLRATISLTRVTAPLLRPIADPVVYRFDAPAVIGKDGVSKKYPINRDWLPIIELGGPSPSRDNWYKFVADPKTVKLDIEFSYGNGFEDNMRGRTISQVFLANWYITDGKHGSGGGGWCDAETVQWTWDNTNKQKADAERGVYPW